MTRNKYYPFAAICPRNLSNLVEEWYAGLPEHQRTERTRNDAHEMGLALSKRLFRDEDVVTNVAHEEFAQACLTLLGGVASAVLTAERSINHETGLSALLCASLFNYITTKLYHRDSGRPAKDIVADAMERAKGGAANE